MLPEATTEPVKALTTYIKDNWADWSVYGQAIRTNNDVEGFHKALNRRACGKVHLPFYLLVQFLHKECQLTEMTIKLVSKTKLKRCQRKKYRNLQAKVFSHWEEYASKKKSASQLIKACSYLNGPIRDI